jgi:hypothetical protein
VDRFLKKRDRVGYVRTTGFPIAAISWGDGGVSLSTDL